jgi:MoxR-like ATPase
VNKVVVGQKEMLEGILMGLLTGGHVLLEGVPGLAKTLTISSVARAISLNFQRIQFTPDLLPTDLIGTMIFNPKSGEFAPKKGPIFTNIALADEINRAPAKVQSALLEAMAEKQVTIGDTTYPLEKPFLVLATQNPLEQEGTYPLPEAQMDRFMFKINVVYPKRAEELEILNRMATDKQPNIETVISREDLLRARDTADMIYVDEKIKNYIVEIVMATREPKEHGLAQLLPLIQVGASPRATISLTRAGKAHAFLRGRGYVTADDVKSIAYHVLRHRLILTYEAEAENMTTDGVIKEILSTVEVP